MFPRARDLKDVREAKQRLADDSKDKNTHGNGTPGFGRDIVNGFLSSPCTREVLVAHQRRAVIGVRVIKKKSQSSSFIGRQSANISTSKFIK